MNWRATALLLAAGAMSAGAMAQDRDAQLAAGKKLFEYWCVNCHGPGIGLYGLPYLPGEMALRAKYKGALPPLLPDRTDMSPEFVKLFVRNGLSIMPFFRKTEIDDQELDLIAAYLSRNYAKPQ